MPPSLPFIPMPHPHPHPNPFLPSSHSCLDCVEKVPVKSGNIYVTCPTTGVGSLTVTRLSQKTTAKPGGSLKLGVTLTNANKYTVYKGLRLAVAMPAGVIFEGSAVSPAKASLFNERVQFKSGSTNKVAGSMVKESYFNGTMVVFPDFFVAGSAKVKLSLSVRVDPSVPKGQTLTFDYTLTQNVLTKPTCPTTVRQNVATA